MATSDVKLLQQSQKSLLQGKTLSWTTRHSKLTNDVEVSRNRSNEADLYILTRDGSQIEIVSDHLLEFVVN